MSVSSLTKFTVPVDSDQSASSQGLLMPKLKYRFRAMFENFGVSTPRTELTKQVIIIKKIIKNKFKNQKIKIIYGGSVNNQNIDILKQIKEINGFLIGGASQNSKKFIDIIKKTIN